MTASERIFAPNEKAQPGARANDHGCHDPCSEQHGSRQPRSWLILNVGQNHGMKGEVWFPAKRYGIGWGLPTCWQGWVAFLIYVAALIAGVLWMRGDERATYLLSYFAGVTAAFLALCWWKGEPLRWRWGDE
jgi:hypothetical protein